MFKLALIRYMKDYFGVTIDEDLSEEEVQQIVHDWLCENEPDAIDRRFCS